MIGRQTKSMGLALATNNTKLQYWLAPVNRSRTSAEAATSDYLENSNSKFRHLRHDRIYRSQPQLRLEGWARGCQD
ncbi:hypothetical protein VTP01DRAFT_10166 [Rhizomucor pusillus]|uniref:uncharacterized protein n=1 Tax=Rhizomucor pusillus TaxID=4840 RepID=UPI003743947F